MMQLPQQEGISKVRRVRGDEAAGPILQRLQSGATLADLQTDYALFTYAPLFLWGGLTHNPIQEWINLTNRTQVVFFFRTEEGFCHIDGATWDRTLWAVEKEYWPELSLHIGTMALLNRPQQQFSRVICQDMPVVDVAALRKCVSVDVLPKVTISIFTVDSNKGCVIFAPGTMQTNWQPYWEVHSPLDETQKLAAALFADSAKPYENIQRYPWDDPNNS